MRNVINMHNIFRCSPQITLDHVVVAVVPQDKPYANDVSTECKTQHIYGDTCTSTQCFSHPQTLYHYSIYYQYSRIHEIMNIVYMLS